MDFFTILGVAIFVYFVLYFVALLRTDCDLELAWAEQFGQKVASLEGKVVWVTGASSGIGKHLALVLAQAGAKLILSARRENELEKVKQECLKVGTVLSSQDVFVLPLDVTAVATHQNCFDKVIEHFGHLDILVNNAGRSQRAVWEDIELDVDKEMFDLNVFGVISLSRIAVNYFIQKGEGHVAVTSSIAGILGVPFSGTYTATKHAIHGYFNSLRIEKQGSNLHVTLLCPGPTFSNFLAESFTNKAGEKFGQNVSATDKRMTAERCGQLCAIALANRQSEAWMGVFPIIPLSYLIYFPNLGKKIINLMGSKALLKLRDSKETVKSK